ncbi:MAG TPA: hypothetical protein VF107_00120 [Burkholderiaceae bacterium]
MDWRVWIVAVPLALAACAGYAPGADVQAGASEAQVVQSMGQPTGRYTMPGGTQRLEFARGPYGQHTWMIDLDAQGRVARVEQVLQPRYFNLVSPGQSRDELLRTIGRPGERMGMMRNGQIWSWRYPNNDCLWWQAQLDAQGVVTAAGYAPEPRCNGNDAGGNRR